MTGSQYYVSIGEPQRRRKDLLETAKLTVDVLKAEYRVKKIREQKKARLAQLKELAHDLSETLDAIEKALPDHDKQSLPDAIKELQKKREEKQKKAQKEQEKEKQEQPEKKVPEKKEPAETPSLDQRSSEADEQLEKLEQKLSQIESKLNKL